MVLKLNYACQEGWNWNSAVLQFTLIGRHELVGMGGGGCCRLHTRRIKHNITFPPIWFSCRQRAQVCCWYAHGHRTERQVSGGWNGHAGVLLHSTTAKLERHVYFTDTADSFCLEMLLCCFIVCRVFVCLFLCSVGEIGWNAKQKL